MIYYLYSLAAMLSSPSTIIIGGEPAPPPASAPAAEVADAPVAGGMGLFGDGGMSMILVWVVLFGGMYFLLIRPQRKREKTLREMQASLQVGNEVVTSSGFFGTIVSIGEDCFIIEFGTGKGVRIPVRKTDVIDRRSPNISVSSKD